VSSFYTTSFLAVLEHALNDGVSTFTMMTDFGFICFQILHDLFYFFYFPRFRCCFKFGDEFRVDFFTVSFFAPAYEALYPAMVSAET
jgi:hypothetical protein